MGREETVEEAATYGLKGFVVLSAAVAGAGALLLFGGVAPLPLLLAASGVLFGVYHAAKQVAAGIYEIADDT